MNLSTPEEEIVEIHRMALDSVSFNMSDMVYQRNYGTINIDYP